MADILTDFKAELLTSDYAIENQLLQMDDSIKTAVMISLFTDGRSGVDDELPSNSNDRKGWWADKWFTGDKRAIGSRLWLLVREKQTSEVVLKAKEYAEESLKWLIDDGVVESLQVITERLENNTLGIQVSISSNKQGSQEFGFAYLYKEGQGYVL